MTFGGGFGKGFPSKKKVKKPIKSMMPLSPPQALPTQTPVVSKPEVEQRSGVAVIGRFSAWPWKQYPDEAYLADALESLDLRVVRLSQDRYTPPISSVECAIFTSHPSSFGRLDRWKQTHSTIMWATDLVPGYPEYDPVIEVSRKASTFISADRFDWGSLGLSHHVYLPGACDPKAYVLSPHPEVPCAFIGPVCSERQRRIVQTVRKLGGTVLDRIALWRYGQNLSSFVQTVKVVVCDNVRNDVPGYWSALNYTIPGAGGFLLTPMVQGLDRDFFLGEELAVYDSEDELESKIIRWMEDDLGRESVRRAGYERAHLEHTWTSRAKSFVQILAEKVYAG